MVTTKDGVKARREALAAFLDRHKLKPHKLAKQAGFTPSTLYNFLAGTSSTLSTQTLEKIAQAVGTTVDEVLGGSTTTKKENVPVLFVVGVHGKMYPTTASPAPRPIGISEDEKIACAVASGDALHPLPSGLMVFFNQDPSPPKSVIGKLCVVRSSCSEEPMIRQVEHGSQPGLYNLIALSSGVIRDVDIIAAHLVRAITQ